MPSDYALQVQALLGRSRVERSFLHVRSGCLEQLCPSYRRFFLKLIVIPVEIALLVKVRRGRFYEKIKSGEFFSIFNTFIGKIIRVVPQVITYVS